MATPFNKEIPNLFHQFTPKSVWLSEIPKQACVNTNISDEDCKKLPYPLFPSTENEEGRGESDAM